MPGLKQPQSEDVTPWLANDGGNSWHDEAGCNWVCGDLANYWPDAFPANWARFEAWAQPTWGDCYEIRLVSFRDELMSILPWRRGEDGESHPAKEEINVSESVLTPFFQWAVELMFARRLDALFITIETDDGDINHHG